MYDCVSSVRHQLWLDRDEDRRDKSLETDNFWVVQGDPLTGMLEYIVHPQIKQDMHKNPTLQIGKHN